MVFGESVIRELLMKMRRWQGSGFASRAIARRRKVVGTGVMRVDDNQIGGRNRHAVGPRDSSGAEQQARGDDRASHFEPDQSHGQVPRSGVKLPQSPSRRHCEEKQTQHELKGSLRLAIAVFLNSFSTGEPSTFASGRDGWSDTAGSIGKFEKLNLHRR